MMDDFISRQAAISLPVLPKEHRHYQTMNLDDAYEGGWFDAIECVEKIPPADVRHVVLCGDCRWFNVTGYPDPALDMPELRIGHCFILCRDVQACWFCGDGEHKEDADG